MKVPLEHSLQLFDLLTSHTIQATIVLHDTRPDIRVELNFENRNVVVHTNYYSTGLLYIVHLLKPMGYILLCQGSRKNVITSGMLTDMTDGTLGLSLFRRQRIRTQSRRIVCTSWH